MSKPAVARICWISVAEGGRLLPPPGPTYTTVARFESQGGKWSENAWSLVIEFIDLPDDSLCHLVRMRYLVRNGPEEWFKVGAKFDLMEGAKIVARGVIIND